MTVQNLAGTVLSVKRQLGLGLPASGGNATTIELTGGSGIARTSAQIVPNLNHPSKMNPVARQGSGFVAAGFETLLQVKQMNGVLAALLGCTPAGPLAFSNTDWGTCTISDTGVTATFSTGTLLTDGIKAGMTFRFTSLSVAGNNAKWVTVLSVDSEGVATLEPGVLADNAVDAAWSVEVANAFFTDPVYAPSYWTAQLDNPDVGYAFLGTDLKWNTMTLGENADGFVTLGFGAGGRELDNPSPVFTSPILRPTSPLILLDGAFLIDGVDRVDLTGFQMQMQAPVSGQSMLRTRLSPDTFLGNFTLSGSLTGVVDDEFASADFAAFLADTRMAAVLKFTEIEGPAGNFISVYVGNLRFGGFSSPAAGQSGALIKTIPLNAGRDVRGDDAGYAPTSMLISTSHYDIDDES